MKYENVIQLNSQIKNKRKKKKKLNLWEKTTTKNHLASAVYMTNKMMDQTKVKSSMVFVFCHCRLWNTKNI